MNEARRLRDAFGAFITGVTVVTTMDGDTPLGFTANSFTSVSLQPPLLLVCPSRHLSSFDVFNRCPHFAVNVLAEDQRDVSTRFASPNTDRFGRLGGGSGDGWRLCPLTNSPLIDGAAAVFSCDARQRVDGGDHIILIGEVRAFDSSGAPALGYANGGYFGMTLERRADALTHDAPKLDVGIIIEHDGRVLMCRDEKDGSGLSGLTLPRVRVARHTGSLGALRQYLADAGLAVNIGAVYAVVENPRSGMHSVYYRGTSADGDGRALGSFEPLHSVADRADAGIAVMLRRYAQEHSGGNFGLYIGDADDGDVHHPTHHL